MDRTVRPLLALALILAALAAGACSLRPVRASARPNVSVSGQMPAGIISHQASPATADPQIAGPGGENLALVGPAAASNGLLLVFLPGTGGRPACCRLFLNQAAALGYHAIGLVYNNSTGTVAERCQNDLGCYATARQNEFDGTSPSAASAAPTQDGIEHRLAALLAYLSQNYPDEGWDAFLAGSLPNYATIVFAGHSQGGGMAAFIASERAVAGVVMLSSPTDTDDQLQAAPWLANVAGGATPLTSYYAFVHTGDPFGARIRSDWTAMGLDALGPVTSVDGAAAPYGGSHELYSSAPLPRVLLANHDSTTVDDAQPRCSDGTLMYAPVWSYLLQAAAGLPLTGPAAACGS